jgi:hypothetical protein
MHRSNVTREFTIEEVTIFLVFSGIFRGIISHFLLFNLHWEKAFIAFMQNDRTEIDFIVASPKITSSRSGMAINYSFRRGANKRIREIAT